MPSLSRSRPRLHDVGTASSAISRPRPTTRGSRHLRRVACCPGAMSHGGTGPIRRLATVPPVGASEEPGGGKHRLPALPHFSANGRGCSATGEGIRWPGRPAASLLPPPLGGDAIGAARPATSRSSASFARRAHLHHRRGRQGPMWSGAVLGGSGAAPSGFHELQRRPSAGDYQSQFRVTRFPQLPAGRETRAEAHSPRREGSAFSAVRCRRRSQRSLSARSSDVSRSAVTT